jgi:hypothetical protein
MRQLCKFLGVRFSPSMLEFYKSDEARRAAESSDLWSNVVRPIMAGNTRKFLHEASEEDIRLFESVAGDVLTALGYDLARIPRGPRRMVSEEDIGRFEARMPAWEERSREPIWSISCVSIGSRIQPRDSSAWSDGAAGHARHRLISRPGLPRGRGPRASVRCLVITPEVMNIAEVQTLRRPPGAPAGTSAGGRALFRFEHELAADVARCGAVAHAFEAGNMSMPGRSFQPSSPATRHR